MGVAIVAIPAEQDPVWKYSSEKVPHMTLIYLGDIETEGPTLAEIESFIQHVVDTSLPRFGMSVDRRGTLGPDDADVLFFKENCDYNVKVARANMLQEPHIRAAYENADQFEGWTPHLTMGYPATPAKKDDREYPGFSWVNFDRLALWIGNYEGPTFQLQDQYIDYPASTGSLVMSETSLSEEYGGVVLEHSGVKGMKWGVHHEKRLQLLKRVANGTASKTERIHVGLTEVSGESVKQTGSLAAAAHHKAQELESRKKRIQKGEGTYKDRLALLGGDRLRETSGRNAVKKFNSEKASPFTSKQPFAKHSFAGVTLDEDILIHHGVKGMKWGVRNDNGHQGEQASGKQIAKADKKFEKAFQPSVANWVKVNNKFADHINPMLDELNSRPEYGRDLTKDRDLHERYFKDYEQVVEKAAEATTRSFGTNASGTRHMKVTRVGFGESATWSAELEDIKHSSNDGELTKFVIVPKFDSTGHIIGQKILDPDAAKHSEADDILAHHGVKGMKWGVRKDVSSDPGTPDTANTDRAGYSSRPVKRAKQEVKDRTGSEVVARTTPGRGVRTVGGNQREASADAIRARTAQQVAKKSTLDALSNKELQDLVTRMNLEQQYNRLAFEEGDSRASTGEKFARKALNDYGDTAVTALASNPTTAAFAVPVGLAITGLKAVDSRNTKKLADAPGVHTKIKKNKNN